MGKVKKYHVVGMPAILQETGDSENGVMSQKAVTEALGKKFDIPEVAEVGQTFAVKAVDEHGTPTEWEAVDFPSGGVNAFSPFAGDWGEPIASVITEEEVRQISIPLPHSYTELKVYFVPAVSSTATDRFMNGNAWIGHAFGGGTNTDKGAWNTAHTNGQIFPSYWYSAVSKTLYGPPYVTDNWFLNNNSWVHNSYCANTTLNIVGFIVPDGHFFGIGTKIVIWARGKIE